MGTGRCISIMPKLPTSKLVRCVPILLGLDLITRNACRSVLTLPPKPSTTGLIVASAVVTTKAPTKSVSPADAMVNMGLDPIKVASLAHDVAFEWNWRVYCKWLLWSR
jgi:hypothetical protein